MGLEHLPIGITKLRADSEVLETKLMGKQCLERILVEAVTVSCYT